MKKATSLSLIALFLGILNAYSQGTITALSCFNSNFGTLTSGSPALGVTSVFSYTGGNGGAYSALNIPSTGVTGLNARLAAGSFASGSGSLTFNITGTPASCGTARFVITIDGKTCTLNRPVAGTTAIGSLNCSAVINSGTLTTGSPASGVSSSIPYTGGTGCPHNGQTVASTGVTGLTATLNAGTFAASGGSGNLTYTISGTPAGLPGSGGIALFAISIGGKTCTLARTVLPAGTITALNCASATHTGVLTKDQPATGISSSVPYTGGNGGTFNNFSAMSAGVSGLTARISAGQFAAGNGSLTVTISGTPLGIGEARFTLNIGGRTCTLIRNVLPVGTITTLNCSGAQHFGQLITGASAGGVFTWVGYSGSNGGSYPGITIGPSSATKGLTATLLPGVFSTAAGAVLVFRITGTPTSSGPATFAFTIDGKTCTFTRMVYNPASLITLNCSGAVHTGDLTKGIAYSSTGGTITTSVPYTGGNGGAYTEQYISSTGVPGLTAYLPAGVLSSSSGSLNLVIYGTADQSGTARFNLSIGGKSCEFTRSVRNGIPASCGAPDVHNPAKTYGTLTDVQGNVYKTIVIGTQEWMAENLKATKYRNGNDIPSGGCVVNDPSTTGNWSYWRPVDAWSWYDCPFGKLYNYYAIADPRGLCPTGWRVPSTSDWNTLISFLGGESAAGKKLKSQSAGTPPSEPSTSTVYWEKVTGFGATNESGFSALGGGYLYPTGADGDCSQGLFTVANFWSSTPSSCCPTLGDAFQLSSGSDGIQLTTGWWRWSNFSVRCIKGTSGARMATDPDSELMVLYPNPATSEGHVNLDLNAREEGQVRIRIVDVLGHVLQEEEHDLQPGKNTLSLGIAGLPAGLYRVQVIQDNEQKSIPLRKQ